MSMKVERVGVDRVRERLQLHSRLKRFEDFNAKHKVAMQHKLEETKQMQALAGELAQIENKNKEKKNKKKREKEAKKQQAQQNDDDEEDDLDVEEMRRLGLPVSF